MYRTKLSISSFNGMLTLVILSFIVTGLAESTRQMRGCNVKCEKQINPACGSDGAIYQSICHLNMNNCGKKIAVLKDAECRRSSGHQCLNKCPNTLDPVCGSDGRTYLNKCKIKVEECMSGTIFSHYGICYSSNETDNCPTDCTNALDDGPICASNGNSYKNSCVMKLKTCGQKVVETSKKHCQTTKSCDEVCTFSYQPVCGSDGKIYHSKCDMDVKNCGRHIFQTPMVHCRPQERTARGCPITCDTEKLSPVCGTDGNIYDNQCDMRRLTCGSSGASTVYASKSIHNCRGRFLSCSQINCPSTKDPVCGTDGTTYPNYCLLYKASCKKGVELAHYGECPNMNEIEDCNINNCQKDEYPVCGSDGNVYASYCDMKNSTCGQKVVAVALHHCKATKDCLTDCPRSGETVCGSDNQMYLNACTMRAKNCGRHVHTVPLKNCLARFNFFRCMRICQPLYEPVCATDGRTYSNGCFLEMEKCNGRSLGRSLVVRAVHDGPCGNPISRKRSYMFR